jgi:hypothetical protein
MAKMVRPLPGNVKKIDPRMEKTKPRMKQKMKPWMRVDQDRLETSTIWE